MLAGLVVLIVVSSLLHRTSTTSTTAATESTQTITALDLVDRAEQLYASSHHGDYSDEIADLIGERKALAGALTEGITVQLDVGTDGKSYDALVESSVLNLLRARQDGKLLTDSCTVVKKESGVSCPGSSTSSHGSSSSSSSSH